LKSVVTGGAGFIGSHLVDLLVESGDEVVVIDNLSTGRSSNVPRNELVQLVEADIAESGAWQESFSGCGRVFHLAALADIVPSIQHPGAYFRSNVDGTFNVLEACRSVGITRVVYAASSSCYGIPDVYPTPETASMRPQYPYALTKLLGEELVMHWSDVYGIAATSLRLFNVYGPRSRTNGTYGAVFGVFLAQKLANEPFTVVGDGTQTRDFTYVTDVARAFLAVADSADASGKILNVGSGGTYSVNHLVTLLGGEVVHVPKRPGEPDCTFADTTLISEATGWQPEMSFEEGVAQVLNHIEMWRDAPVWTPGTIAEATRDWFKYLGRVE
jgi:UDP-glucose 4-epimerase